jgi:hypothetical protein
MAYYPYYGFFSFEQTMTQWQNMGVFDIILPLIMIFTIVYAVLERTKIFGPDKKSINAVIAIAVSFMAMQNLYITSFFKILFAQVALGLAILVALVIITGLLMGSKNTHSWKFIITILGFMVFVWMFSRAADEYQMYYGVYAFGIFTSDWWAANASWLILLAIVAIVVIAVTSSSKGDAPLEKIARTFIGED